MVHLVHGLDLRRFVHAELADWNYTPLGLDACTNFTLGCGQACRRFVGMLS